MNINFTGTVGIINDPHIPFEDRRTLQRVVSFLTDLQPDLLLLPGDFNDFYACSKFDKDPARANRLQRDLNRTAGLFANLRQSMPNTRIIFELGNHEDRLRRYLWSTAPALASLDCLTVEGLLKLEANEIECVDYGEGVLLNKKLWVTHGDIIRTHSAYTAKGMSDKHGKSGIHGHTHRGGSYYKRDRFGFYGWWENFCLCGLEPAYVQHPNWMQGFSVVTVIRDRFFVEQIPVIDRKFIYGGRVYGGRQ